MFLVDCQTDQNFSHFLWHLNHKSFIEELLLTNDQSCDTWPLLDFVPLVILVAICFEVFQASNAMKWRSNFAFFQNYKSHFLQQFNKYFRVRQGKIHFQYHIVGPERKYWKWISIHFLPPINHIWPPGANISCSPKKMISFIKYQTNSLGDQFFNCETWKFVSQFWTVKRQFWAGKGIIFSGEKAILCSFLIIKINDICKKGNNVMYHSTPDKYNPVCNTKSTLDLNELRIVFFNKCVGGRWGVNVCPDDWSTGKINKDKLA